MMNLKRKINNNKAITLIALVITIIIMLILASITIAQLSGNNLFENAKLAKENYKRSKELEDEILGDYEDAITGDRGNKVSYSTEEQVVGTWIDGKPLYQKVMTIKFNGVGTDNYARVNPEVLIDDNYKAGFIENVFTIGEEYDFQQNGLANISGNSGRNFFIHGKYVGAWAGNDSGCANKTFYVIVKYTKTTD